MLVWVPATPDEGAVKGIWQSAHAGAVMILKQSRGADAGVIHHSILV